MTSAVEEIFGHTVAWEIVYGTERYPDDVALSVLTQRNGKFLPTYAQRHIHDSFSIALQILETLELLPGNIEYRRMSVGEDLKLVEEYMPHKPVAKFCIVVVELAINQILIDAHTHKFAYDDIDVWVVRIVCKTARVGTHARIKVLGAVPIVQSNFRSAAYLLHGTRVRMWNWP